MVQSLDSSLVRHRGIPLNVFLDKVYIPEMFGASVGTGFDNTVALSTMLNSLSDNDTVDFGGNMYRVYSNVQGISSATANPNTDNALPYEQVLKLVGKKGITLRNGGIYAANQGVAPEAKYFPSTLSLIMCEDFLLDDFTLESKGEGWGNADASYSTGYDRRLQFLATNGGHALYMGRCKGIKTMSSIFRLCGSTAPVYFSSCDNISFTDCFSNSASLGYAAYCADKWVGNDASTGFSEYRSYMINSSSHCERVLRREDSAVVGSDSICGKAGVVVEDEGVHMSILGGVFSDMYGNGADKWLGAAFAATSGGTVHSVGSKVRNCQSVGLMHWNTNAPATLIIEDVDADVGLTGIMLSPTELGSAFARLSGTVRVTKQRAWLGERLELSETSLVANMKPTSTAIIELDVTTPESSDIHSLIINEGRACYGGVTILGGNYVTNGYLIRSVGWGGITPNYDKGLIITSGKFHDKSSHTEPYIKYSNVDSLNTYTYVHHDLSCGIFTSNAFRALDSYVLTNESLVEVVKLPRPKSKLYISDNTHIERGDTILHCVSVDGLVGTSTTVTFNIKGNYAPPIGALILSQDGSTTDRIIGPTGNFREGSPSLGVILQMAISGDVRSHYEVGKSYRCVRA